MINMKDKKLAELLPDLHMLIKLYLTVPLSNATAERTLSALRRVKTYLRSTMTQKHLNHYLLLHVHKDLTDKIDMKAIARQFISYNDRRKAFFGKL